MIDFEEVDPSLILKILAIKINYINFLFALSNNTEQLSYTFL